MKTSTFSLKNASIYYIVIFLSIILTSCGSYQNSSYYDGDGIYGNTNRKIIESENHNTPNNYYKNYFGSLQDNNQSPEIFTDVDSYNTYNDSIQGTNQNYGGWGSNSRETVINVSPNYWGLSLGYGMSYPYYGYTNYGYGYGYPYYGYNYPYYGYSGFGWDYPYYGFGFGYLNYPNYGYGYNQGYYNNNYTYNPSRRGSSYSNIINSSRNYSSRNSGDYSKNETTSYRGSNYRNSAYNSARTSPTFTRNQNQNNTFSNSNRRTSTNSSRNETNNTTSRSYTPSSRSDSNSSRSYNSSSSGSSYSGGSGRSSGGGGRR